MTLTYIYGVFMAFTLVLGSLVFATSGVIIHVFEKLKLPMISFRL